MAKIIPFKAVRPTPENASLVTARSYEDYSAAELAAQLEFNPLSFLHVLHPAYNKQERLTIEERFQLVDQKYREFKNEGILIQDEKPSVYIHRIITRDKMFTGIILGTSIDDYKNDIIKKHEDTLQFRVEMFRNYIKYAGFNTEPVLMTYRDNESVAQWLADKTSGDPDIVFTTTNKHIHQLWQVGDEEEIIKLQNAFDEIGNLYIADGHHRSASAELLYDENGTDAMKKYFLSFLIADSNVKTYGYHRMVKDLNGLTKQQFIDKLKVDFDLEPQDPNSYYPASKHEFGVCFKDQYYRLTLKSDKRAFASPLDSLDVQILYLKVLSPILGLTDLRNAERIEYLSGKLSVADIKERIELGEFTVGFVLFPTDINEIKAIADAHQIMPPKSTYIEPKFRSGLVVYELKKPNHPH